VRKLVTSTFAPRCRRPTQRRSAIAKKTKRKRKLAKQNPPVEPANAARLLEQEPAQLRGRAERKPKALKPKDIDTLFPEEANAPHELQVHQAEAEMPNDKLRATRGGREASRARSQDLFQRAPVAQCTLSQMGLILGANLTAATQLGMAQSELVRKALFRFIFKDDQDIYYRCRRRLFETGQPQGCELRMIKKDGALVWMRLEMSAPEDDNGWPVCRVVMSDITAHKRAKEELRLAKFSVEHAPDPVFWTNPQGRIVYANAAACRSLGRSRDELLSLSIPEINPLCPKETWEKTWEEVSQLGSMTFETQHRTKQGIVFPVEITATHLEFEGKEYGLACARDISGRKWAEEALRRSEERYRTLFENATVGIYRTTADGRVLAANPTLVRMLGYDSFDELYARNLEREGFDPRYPRRTFREQMDREAVVKGLETAWLRRDGSTVVIRESARAIRGDDGRLMYYDGIVEDITEHKRAEIILQENQAELAAAQRLAHIGSWRWNLRTDEAFWSDETFRIFGQSPGPLENHGARFLEMIHADDQTRVNQALTAALQGTKEYDVEYRLVRPDGVERIVEAQAEVLRDEAGRPTVMRGTVHDITERKHTEEALRLTQFSVEHASDAVFWMNSQGRIVYVNEAACCSLGYSRQELLSLSIADIDPLLPQEAWEKIWKEVKARHSVMVETQHRTKRGKLFPVEITATYLEFEGKEYSFASARNITERKRADERIKASEERFRKAFMTGADAFFIQMLDEGRYIEVNDRFEEIYGYTRFEVIGKTVSQLGLYVDPAEREKVVSTIKSCGRIRNLEIRGRKKGGELITVLLSANLLGRSDGKSILGVVRDITEQKRAEEQLRKLSRAVWQSPASVLITDLEGNIEYVNPKFTSLTGYSLEEVVGKNPRFLRSGLTPVASYHELWETVLRIPMKVVSDSDLIPVTCSEVKAVVFGAKRRWRSYRA
jgi:PAS domain S-box-containing protein